MLQTLDMATAERLPHTPLGAESPHNGIPNSLWEIAEAIEARVQKNGSTEEQVVDAVLDQIEELTEGLHSYKEALVPLIRKTLQICGKDPRDLTTSERLELNLEAYRYNLNPHDFKATAL